MIDTETVARALSRTLGGEWKYIESAEVFFDMHALKEVADPRESTDVCMEMLHARMKGLHCDWGTTGDDAWEVADGEGTIRLPTSGQPFREAVIRLCAGEE